MDGNASNTRGDASPRFFERELSWLAFNQRVQMEADNPENPLLERAKFLSIVSSNLDEFVQVRYHRLLEAAGKPGGNRASAGGLSPRALLARVDKTMLRQQNMQYLLYEGIHSELYHLGVQLYPIFSLTDEMRARVKEFFLHDLLPKLRPYVWGEEISPTSQKKVHLMVKLRPGSGSDVRYMSFSMPATARLYELPSVDNVRRFIRQEDVVRLFLPILFPEDRAEEASMYRIIRNQDFPLDERVDVAAGVQEMLLMRRAGDVMRIEAEERMSAELLDLLMRRFRVTPERKYRVTGPLDLGRLMMSLYGQLDRPNLKYRKYEPVSPPELTGADIFGQIARRDWLLFHPYHSFEPVVNFLNRAAADPDVCSIKTTLYRVGGNSPVVRALLRAAENGKQVSVLFEARARFDEDNNLSQGERLRRSGCAVCYGLPHYKTHSKALLVTRMENGQPRRYLHLGTGNYHDGTARLYTDMALFTADPALGEDAAKFFYGLEGNASPFATSQLIQSPARLKQKLLGLIGREREHALSGLPSGIVAKMNSLLDAEIIEALYRAGEAGVPIRLIIRGVCTLVPGNRHLTGDIRVLSIVGRHLEHARAFRFENGGEPEVYLSSADWMPRNLDRRVELMFPVKDPACRQAVENVLALQLRDNCKSWLLKPDGAYERTPADGLAAVNAQEALMADPAGILGRPDAAPPVPRKPAQKRARSKPGPDAAPPAPRKPAQKRARSKPGPDAAPPAPREPAQKRARSRPGPDGKP
ncbi:MAG: polyphosphate kinase 1 [Clostridiales bacterium]|nr:polyphosphate kinase 1 [Clostridiales bacterium]